MRNKQKNLEDPSLKPFEDIAKKLGCKVFKKMGADNRILLKDSTFFQFGDLRVDTKKYHIIVETESAGGVTNLAKYWYCIKNKINCIENPIILIHIFRQTSDGDYSAHLVLWDFIWRQMKKDIGNDMEAFCYVYHEVEDLKPAVDKFKEYLIKKNAGGD